MGISKKVKRVMKEGSWIRKMFEEGVRLKEEFGENNVFDLSLGNPVFEPPKEFRDELKRIANSDEVGTHRYMPNAGYSDTRHAIASQLELETRLGFTENHVVMTCGAGGALNVVMKSLLDPGDEVVVFAPYFVEYMFYADNHGGVCKIVPPDPNFLPDFDIFEKTITSRTRIVLINTPNNPTGVVYNGKVLSRLTEIIHRKENEFGIQISLVSDEPYRKILFDGLDYPQIFGYHRNSIVATSHSKDLALPGERIGFIAVNPSYLSAEELLDGLIFCNRTLGFVNAPALMQRIVTHLQTITIDVSRYESKRDFMYSNLVDMGYEIVRPQGAFYMFPKAPISDDFRFVKELGKHRVLVVPGSGFGLPGYFRIAYCIEDDTLKRSLDGFRAAMMSFS
jgi:aspartate aminotransferase